MGIVLGATVVGSGAAITGVAATLSAFGPAGPGVLLGLIVSDQASQKVETTYRVSHRWPQSESSLALSPSSSPHSTPGTVRFLNTNVVLALTISRNPDAKEERAAKQAQIDDLNKQLKDLQALKSTLTSLDKDAKELYTRLDSFSDIWNLASCCIVFPSSRQFLIEGAWVGGTCQ